MAYSIVVCCWIRSYINYVRTGAWNNRSDVWKRGTRSHVYILIQRTRRQMILKIMKLSKVDPKPPVVDDVK